MPHNFRRHIELGLAESACCFVSKAGSDANNGLTPDTPKKTILAAAQLDRPNVIVGADVYAGEQLGSIYADKFYYADGCVVLKGDAGLTLAQSVGFKINFNDFIIFKYEILPVGKTNNQNGVYYTRCYITGGEGVGTGYDSTQFSDCTLKGVSLVDNTQLSAGISILYCNVLGSSVDARGGIHHSYFDAASTLSMRDGASAYDPQIVAYPSRLNNIRCSFSYAGTQYSSLADFRAVNTAHLPGSINLEPDFSKADKDDYTLKITSPHLNLGIGPRHLRLTSGWFIDIDANPGEDITINNIKLRSAANPAYFITPISTSNLIANSQGGIEVKPNSLGNNEGVIVWQPRRIAEAPTEINYYNFTTGLNFNSDYTTDAANPSPYNSNVPDYSNASAGSAGRKPNRLSEQWRWSRGVLPDPNDSSAWVTGSVFLDFELFRAPWYNTSPIRGNADVTFDWNSPKELPSATFVQSRWKLRQDRAI